MEIHFLNLFLLRKTTAVTLLQLGPEHVTMRRRDFGKRSATCSLRSTNADHNGQAFQQLRSRNDINDKRLPADFAKAVIEGRDLEILSDGKPTRTFCYISDAINGYLKVLLHDKFDVFNIGMDKPELSVREFAEIFNKEGKAIFDYKGKISFRSRMTKIT